MIDLASRPGNRGAFLTQHVANGAAKTQRLNSLPQFHLLWVSELNPSSHERSIPAVHVPGEWLFWLVPDGDGARATTRGKAKGFGS